MSLRVSAGVLAIAVLGLLETGCLVQVERVRDPGPAFRQARAEALRYQGRPGPAHQLNVLVYDRDEGKLVRAELPMWLVRKLERRAGESHDWDVDFDADGRVKHSLDRHLRLEDVEKAGLGVLVEVEEDDGGRVLVWLK